MPTNSPLPIIACCLFGLLTAACAGRPVSADDPPQAALPSDVVIVDSRPAPPPSPMYDVLVGEIAAQRGDYKTALEHYLESAREHRDVRLAERATHFGIYAREDALALEAAHLWLELQPENLLIYRILANLELRRGELEAGLAHLERYLEAEADLDEGLRQVGAILARLPEKPLALQAAGRIAASHAEVAAAHQMHGLIARHAADLELAAGELGAAVRLDPDWAQARIQQAQVLVALGRGEAALATLAEGVARLPDDRDLRLAYARMLMNLQRAGEARAQFEALAASRPGDPDILYALALLSLELAQYGDAEGYLRQLERGEARADDARFFLGRLEAERGNHASALDWYRKVAGGEYASEAHIQAAATLARMGRLEPALAEVRQLRAAEPQLRERLLLVEGELLIEADRAGEAMALYGSALQEDPDSSELLYARAMLAERVDRLDLLESDLKRLLEHDPENASALNALGYTLADRTDRHAEALDFIQRALALRPEDPAIIDSMGWVHYRLGNLPLALNYLQDAFARSQDPEIAAHLGEVLWETGEVERARQILLDAWRDHADNEVLRQTVERYRP